MLILISQRSKLPYSRFDVFAIPSFILSIWVIWMWWSSLWKMALLGLLWHWISSLLIIRSLLSIILIGLLVIISVGLVLFMRLSSLLDLVLTVLSFIRFKVSTIVIDLRNCYLVLLRDSFLLVCSCWNLSFGKYRMYLPFC